MRFIVATHNKDKLKEIKEILRDFSFEVSDLASLGFDEEIVEDGSTFAENARIKVQAVARVFPNDYIMADDSGLSVDCLDGRPGIHSARYMGEDTAYSEKIAALQAEIAEKWPAPRTARFVCAICCRRPDGSEFVVEGIMPGEIATEVKGNNGFGYDPVFYLPEYGKNSAELEPEEKNRISHRGQALRKMVEQLSETFSKD